MCFDVGVLRRSGWARRHIVCGVEVVWFGSGSGWNKLVLIQVVDM